MRNRGFTLIELIVVISVIAVLAGIILPTIGAIIDDAKTAKGIAEVKHLATACLQYDKQQGNLPYQNLLGGNINYAYTLDAETAGTPTYINRLNTHVQAFVSRRILKDPFNMPYRYYMRNIATYPNFKAVTMTAGKNKNWNWVWSAARWNTRAEPAATETSYYMVFK
jgi:prepilin-type N-terminal cleavage/methylation domain-containing protein